MGGGFARYDLPLQGPPAENVPNSAHEAALTPDLNLSQNTAGIVAQFLQTELFQRDGQLLWLAADEPVGFFPFSVMPTLYARRPSLYGSILVFLGTGSSPGHSTSGLECGQSD